MKPILTTTAILIVLLTATGIMAYFPDTRAPFAICVMACMLVHIIWQEVSVKGEKK
jgi:hypothetical protein